MKKEGGHLVNSDKESFRDMSIGVKIFIVVSVGVIVLGGLLFSLFVYYFGLAGIFRLLDVSYESSFVLLKYAVYTFLLCMVLDIISKPILALFNSVQPSAVGQVLFRALVDTFFTWLALHTIDQLMESITISTGIEWICAFLLFIVDWALDDRKKAKNAQKEKEEK